MIEFAHPMWLWGIAAAPVVVLATVLGGRMRRAKLGSFVGTALQGTLAPGYSWRRYLAKGLLRAIAVAALVTALAGPRFGSQLVKVERQGIDLVIALDTSLSMLAEDVRPNRLERAKHEIVDILAGLDGDRVGVVAFAGEAMALCPLTVDYAAALMLVRSVDVYTISEPGSAIAEAIEIATGLFEGAGEGDRAIILVTDGENQEGDPVQAARAAAEKNIRVFAIGMGSPKGELIPERGSDGTVSGYKKDPRGETVLSRLDEKTLEAVASASGGKYLPATMEGLEIKVLYDEIAGMQEKLIKGEFIERKKERFWIPLVLAFVSLLLDALISTRATRRRGARARLLHTGAAAAVVLAILPTPVLAKDAVDRGKVRSANKLYKKGEFKDAHRLYREALGDSARVTDAPGVFYNDGNALYMQNQYDRALESYQNSYSPDSVLTGNMLYNRGNALLKSGKFDEAIESYVQSLQYLPDDEDARHNLELALAAKQQQQQQQQQQQGDQGQPEKRESGESGSDSSATDPQENQDPATKPDSTQAQPQSAEPDQPTQQPRPDSTGTAPLTEEELRKLSPEDAARILQALQEREQELQKERRKAAFRRAKRSGKDW